MLKFRFFGFPTVVQPAFFIIAAFLGATGGGGLADLALWVGIVFVSVFAHELGHATVARAFGRHPTITLHGSGGLTSYGGPSLGTARDIAVTLAGPMAGLIVGAIVWKLVPAEGLSPIAQTAREMALWVNVGWSILNLLPIWPLDGGQITGHVLGALFGPGGRRGTHIVSIAVAGGGAAYSLLRFGISYTAFLGAMLAWTNVRALSTAREASRAADDYRQRHRQGDPTEPPRW